MTVENINIDETLKKVTKLLAEDKGLSSSARSLMELLVVIITLLANRVGLNSSNSSKPPASDPNRRKTSKKKNGKSPGGQQGHIGTTLKKIDDPDKIEIIKVDRSLLPKGKYREIGFETRQVFDIDISRFVTEYRVQILEDEHGRQYTASFPEGVTKAVQYGANFKAHAVYLSQFQLIPYDRIRDYFTDLLGIPVSAGSIFNFNREAFESLADFDALVKKNLSEAALLHADETGVNINGKRFWLHCASNEWWTYFSIHKKRGKEAMDSIGILPSFQGILCHDHWKPYFKYDECTHSLCNAHHIRELTRAWEQDGYIWAKKLKELLEEINRAVHDAGGILQDSEAEEYRRQYRQILNEAEYECPPPDESKRKNKRGRIKRSKARNLLERLGDYETEVLRFMSVAIVPFTNNQGENDIRMTKVQQKISGCFRSEDGAKFFCRIRSFISSCRKQGISASTALGLLFKGHMPEFGNC
jgi:transposase